LLLRDFLLVRDAMFFIRIGSAIFLPLGERFTKINRMKKNFLTKSVNNGNTNKKINRLV
jgi:hypothetical protein